MSGQALTMRLMQFGARFKTCYGEESRLRGTGWLFTRFYLAKHCLHLVKGMAVTASRSTSDAGS